MRDNTLEYLARLSELDPTVRAIGKCKECHCLLISLDESVQFNSFKWDHDERSQDRDDEDEHRCRSVAREGPFLLKAFQPHDAVGATRGPYEHKDSLP